MAFAVEEGWRKDDPTTASSASRIDRTAFTPGTRARSRHSRHDTPSAAMARLALALLLYTAQRRSDVVRMGRQHVRDGVVQVRQQKTGAMLAIPLHPASPPSSRRRRAIT